MGLLSFLFGMGDMDRGVEEFRQTPGAVLLDVRTEAEYAEGHVEGSVNLPLNRIGEIELKYPDRQTPLFVHCRSGMRSGQAVSQLDKMGYARVKNIGGITSYSGKVIQ